MDQYCTIIHEDGRATLIRAHDISEAKRKYIQLGFSLYDVVSIERKSTDKPEESI